jgi:hypothetical protein
VAKQTLRIQVDPFDKIPPRVRTEIRDRAAELGNTLGVADVEVKVS